MLAGSITSSQISSVAASTLTGTQTIPRGTLPTGSVLQVVTGTTSTSVTNTTTTPADTGLTATITPNFSTSKILIVFTQNGLIKGSGDVNNGVNIKLLRNATDLGTLINACCYTGTSLQVRGSASASVFDAPATTSALTYKTQFFNVVNASNVLVNEGPATSSIILMEISQ